MLPCYWHVPVLQRFQDKRTCALQASCGEDVRQLFAHPSPIFFPRPPLCAPSWVSVCMPVHRRMLAAGAEEQRGGIFAHGGRPRMDVRARHRGGRREPALYESVWRAGRRNVRRGPVLL